MHESLSLPICSGKIEAVSQENDNAKVLRVKVKLGALSHISPDHFREHFEHGVKNTLIEGAKLDIEVLKDINDPCAQEIILDSIEVEAS